MTYDIILFDLDDTLFDFTKAEQHAFSEVFRAYRLDDDLQTYKTHYEQISSALWQALEQGDITLTELGSERFRRLFAQHNLDLDAVAFNEAYLTYLGKQTELVEGAERVIHALINDWRLLRTAIRTFKQRESQIPHSVTHLNNSSFQKRSASKNHMLAFLMQHSPNYTLPKKPTSSSLATP